MMNHRRNVSIFAAALLLAQPVLAASTLSKEDRDRQLHEMVFKNYPPRALAAGEQGPVFFSVTLDKDGAPLKCEVTHGSGFRLLDEETCVLIVQHAVFSAPRDSHGHVTKQTAEGVVNWTLPGHAPAPVVLPAAAAAKPEPQICKRNTKIGTLSAIERTCMTPTEWARQGDETKQVFEETQSGRKTATNCVSLGVC